MPVIEIDIDTARMNSGLERSVSDLRQVRQGLSQVNGSVQTFSREVRTASTSINTTNRSSEQLERTLQHVQTTARNVTQEMSSLQRSMNTSSTTSQALGRNMDTIRSAFGSLQTGAVNLVGKLQALSAIFAGGISLKETVDAAKDFEYALYQCTKVTDESTDKIRKKILELPAGLGTYTELTTGYYQTISAGVTDPVKALETLQSASKLAAVAEVTQSDAIRALTKMMAGYRGELKDTTQAASLLLDIEQYGQTSTKELVPVIGDVSSMSKTAGVSFKEMGASLSVLTQTAGSTSQATTQLRALETSLLNTNETMTKIIQSLGSKNFNDLIGKNGFAGSLALIEQAAKKSDIELAKAYGSSEAFVAATALSANGFKQYAEVLDQIGTKTGRLNESYSLLEKTAKDKMDGVKEAFTNVLTLVGEQFLPIVKDGLDATTKVLEDNKNKFTEWGREGARVVEALADTFVSFKQVVESVLNVLPDGSGYAIAGGLIGYKLFGPAGVLVAVIASVHAALASMLESLDARIGGIQARMNASAVATHIGSDAEDWEELAADAAEAVRQNGGKPIEGIEVSSPEASVVTKPSAKSASAEKSAYTSPTLPKNYTPVSSGSSKSKKSGKSSAETLAENSARYQASLSKLRNEVEALESSLDGTTSAYDRQVKAIEAEKDAAIKNADIVAEETIRRKQATAEQANETASLQKRKAELVAQQKLDELNTKTLQDKANFYKELATATNDDSVAMETQVALLEKQKQLWIDMGIPIKDVNQLYDIQKNKILATPWDKVKNHMEEYFQSASDWSENFNQVWDTTMSNLGDALAEFVKSGELDLQDLLDSFISMCIQMQMQAAASGLFNFIGSAVGSLFTAGVSSSVSTATAPDGKSIVATGALGGHAAHGNVYFGGNLSSYSNSIVTQPTFFGYGKHLSAYAQGAGLMGEAGPEAIMPLTRMSNGNLGVETSGSLPEVNITVINQGSDSTAQVTNQRSNSTGGMDIEVMICQAVASDIASRNGGPVAKAIQSTYGVKRYVRGV